jgi:hypothetical protein
LAITRDSALVAVLAQGAGKLKRGQFRFHAGKIPCFFERDNLP